MTDNPNTISADKLCTLTGLTDRRHRQLAKDGWFPPPVKSEYQLVPTLRGLFKFFGERLNKKTSADERVKTARAELLEHRIEVERGNYIAAEEVRRTVMRGFNALKTRILVVPRRVSQAFAVETDSVTIEQKLDDELRDALSEIASLAWYEKDKPQKAAKKEAQA